MIAAYHAATAVDGRCGDGMGYPIDDGDSRERR
jgi:hypothetical protein